MRAYIKSNKLKYPYERQSAYDHILVKNLPIKLIFFNYILYLNNFVDNKDKDSYNGLF